MYMLLSLASLFWCSFNNTQLIFTTKVHGYITVFFSTQLRPLLQSHFHRNVISRTKFGMFYDGSLVVDPLFWQAVFLAVRIQKRAVWPKLWECRKSKDYCIRHMGKYHVFFLYPVVNWSVRKNDNCSWRGKCHIFFIPSSHMRQHIVVGIFLCQLGWNMRYAEGVFEWIYFTVSSFQQTYNILHRLSVISVQTTAKTKRQPKLLQCIL